MILPRHQYFELDPSSTQLLKRELVTDLEVAIALAALLTYDAGKYVVPYFLEAPDYIFTSPPFSSYVRQRGTWFCVGS